MIVCEPITQELTCSLERGCPLSFIHDFNCLSDGNLAHAWALAFGKPSFVDIVLAARPYSRASERTNELFEMRDAAYENKRAPVNRLCLPDVFTTSSRGACARDLSGAPRAFQTVVLRNDA